MTYRELQRALKAFKLNGYDVQVKLNASKEVLLTEYNRLNNFSESTDDTATETSYTRETATETTQETPMENSKETVMETAQKEYVSASVILLLPILLLSMVTLVSIGIAVTLWRKALTNREFRDTVMQLSTSTQNVWEDMVAQIRFA